VEPDVLFRRDGGRRPEVIVTDTGSYSDVVFGLVHLLGMQYRPALADIPDQKGWRIHAGPGADADYGPLNRFARVITSTQPPDRHSRDVRTSLAKPFTCINL
jgi:TnpA family transposase